MATKDELINNLETYLPYVLEYYQLISNSTAFVDAIVDFYFAGNVSSTLGQNITEVPFLFFHCNFEQPAILRFNGKEMNSYLLFRKFRIQAVSDSVFLWPAYQTIRYQSELMNSSAYFYLFSYEGTFTSTFSFGLPKHYGKQSCINVKY